MVRAQSLPAAGTCLRCESETPLGPGRYCRGCVVEMHLLLQALFSKSPRRLSQSLPPILPVLPRLRAPASSPRRLLVALVLVLLAAGAVGSLGRL